MAKGCLHRSSVEDRREALGGYIIIVGRQTPPAVSLLPSYGVLWVDIV